MNEHMLDGEHDSCNQPLTRKDNGVKSTKTPDSSEQTAPFLTSQRWILAYMGLFYGVLLYVLRVNMSMALACMVNSQPPSISTEFDNHSVSTNQSYVVMAVADKDEHCMELSFNSTVESQTAEFTWDKTLQSFVLSSYYYGVIVTQIPGGWLSGRYGGKHVISIAMAISSLVTLLMPVLARFSVYAVIFARTILGLCSGAAMPGWFALTGVWALPNERSRFVSMFWLGQNAGTIIGYSTSGLLCARGFDNGWGSIFYIHGIFGVIFVLLWQFCVYSSPEQHPRISDAERRLLSGRHQPPVKKEKQPPIPWVKILTYVPVWAVFVTHVCLMWIFYLILICLPLFLKEVLKLDIQSNGFFASLPFICMAVGLASAGWLADHIISKRWFTRTTTRKIFQTIGSVGAAIFIVISGYITCDKREVVIICLCFCTFTLAFSDGASYSCNPIDMSPRHGSLIFAISNTIATLPGMLAPLAVAELTQNQTSAEWRVVFFIAAGMAVFAAIVYDCFSSSELAPWANDIVQEIEIDVETIPDTLLKQMPQRFT